MSLFAGYSYAVAAVAGIGTWVGLTAGAGKPTAHWRVQLALFAHTGWAALSSAIAFQILPAGAWVLCPELARSGAWLLAIPTLAGARLRSWSGRINILFVAGALLGALYSSALSLLLLAIVGLVNVEQLTRNAPAALRRPARVCAAGLGGLFACDLFLYSQQLMLGRPDTDGWGFRGLASALLVPFAATGLRRTMNSGPEIRLSRQVVFYTTAFVGVGAYLLMAAAGGYMVRVGGGEWSYWLQPLLFVCAGLGLVALLVADSPWRRLRVFLAKHFYRTKYDHRAEWLRFVATLGSRDNESVHTKSVRAVAQIIQSPGGVLFVQEDWRGPFLPTGSWSESGAPLPPVAPVDDGADLTGFLARTKWVVDLQEYIESPGTYGHLELPEWMLQPQSSWHIVSPLFERERLLGFFVLQAPPKPFSMIYEDRDLLNTCGRHVATLVMQHAVEQRLAEGRQFDAFNRLAAFVMHDLKNSVAQLQLLASNATRHRHNPDFVNDAFTTIENTVGRMTRLIEQLQGRGDGAVMQSLDPAAALREAVARVAMREPAPLLQSLAAGLRVRADPEGFGSALDHILRNAQDAAGPAGRVSVELSGDQSSATAIIADTGPGMDPAFVRERLFRPFDSTKGSRGMGVGAYQVREYMRRVGGEVEVQSSPGAGTRFIVRLPLCQ